MEREFSFFHRFKKHHSFRLYAAGAAKGAWRLTALLLCALLLGTALLPAGALAAETDGADSGKTVRIGWYQSDLFQEGMSDDEVKSGYSYEYTHKVSAYNGWTYSYVYGDWTELYNALLNGEIDLLAGVSKTDERIGRILFPDEAMGYEHYVLYQHTGGDMDENDISTLKGKKLGAIRDNLMTDYLEQWISDNHAEAEIVYYDSFEARDADFDAGLIDGVVTTNNGVLVSSGYAEVAEVGRESYYLAIAVGREDLLRDLNAALSNLDEIDPYFMTELEYECYGTTLANSTLSETENAWLAAHDTLTIGCLDNYLPFSAADENGNITGLVQDVVNAMLDVLGLSGRLTVNYKIYTYYSQLVGALKAGEIDAIFPTGGSTWQLEQEGIKSTSNVMTTAEYLVYSGKWSEEKTARIAVSARNEMSQNFVREYYPDAEIVECASITDCLQAVLDGKADSALLNALRTNLVSESSKYAGLSLERADHTAVRSFGVTSGNAGLLMLLNRGLKLIGSDYGSDAAYNYLSDVYETTAADYMYEHRGVITSLGILVLLLIVGFVLFELHRSRRVLKAEQGRNEALAEREKELERSAMEQQKHIREISVLNGQLQDTQAEQEQQIEEITQLNGTLVDFTNIMTNAGFGVWHIILKDGAVPRMQANDTMQRLLGIRGQDLTEEQTYSAWYDQIVPEALPSVQASVGEMLDGKFSENTYQWRHPEKGIIYVRCGGTAEKLADGTTILGGYHADVTDIVLQDEQQKQALAEAVEAAEKANNAKTTFLFNMSHDIRTPMNAIMGFRDLLEKYQDDPERRADYLKKIADSSRVLLSIINNVLEMARIEKGTVTVEESVTDVEQLSGSIAAVFDEMMRGKDLTFLSSIEVKHHSIWCDPVKLREIYLNILSNAYKYTPAGGRVDMRIEELPCDREGWASFRTTVTDTGIGMSREFLPHIFEEFSREQNTTEAKVEGTGLGMPIVKRLVEMLGGTIEVESEKGKGSTFTVLIQHRIAADSVTEEATPDEDGEKTFENKRILLAEDNELNAEIATELLTEMGFMVERAENGAVCVEMLKKAEDGYYDLVLMDIQMPVMNGYEAARAIRRLEDPVKANIPVVAMTANAFEEDKQEALNAGMNGHLAKPIDVEKLVRTLNGILK